MKVTFDVSYLPFSLDPEGQVNWVGTPFIMVCESHYWELLADSELSWPDQYYLLALWAVVKARCEIEDPRHAAPGGFIGPAYSLLGLAPFNVDGKLSRRLRKLLYRGFAEQAARALRAEAALHDCPGYWSSWGEPDSAHLEQIIAGMFA